MSLHGFPLCPPLGGRPLGGWEGFPPKDEEERCVVVQHALERIRDDEELGGIAGGGGLVPPPDVPHRRAGEL